MLSSLSIVDIVTSFSRVVKRHVSRSCARNARVLPSVSAILSFNVRGAASRHRASRRSHSDAKRVASRSSGQTPQVDTSMGRQFSRFNSEQQSAHLASGLLRKIGLACVAFTLIWLTLVSSVSAHAFLKQSTPDEDTVVPQAPPELLMSFTEHIEPQFSSAQLLIKRQSGPNRRQPRWQRHNRPHPSTLNPASGRHLHRSMEERLRRRWAPQFWLLCLHSRLAGECRHSEPTDGANDHFLRPRH